MNPVTVTITRPRDPLEGVSLAVLGRVHRHGRLELLVALPDGSKRLVPAQWTDHDTDDAAAQQVCGAVAVTVGRCEDLLAACGLVSALSARQGGEQAAQRPPCKEDSHAACATQSAAGSGSGAIPVVDSPTPRTQTRGRGRVAGPPDRQGEGLGPTEPNGGERR